MKAWLEPCPREGLWWLLSPLASKWNLWLHSGFQLGTLGSLADQRQIVLGDFRPEAAWVELHGKVTWNTRTFQCSYTNSLKNSDGYLHVCARCTGTTPSRTIHGSGAFLDCWWRGYTWRCAPYTDDHSFYILSVLCSHRRRWPDKRTMQTQKLTGRHIWSISSYSWKGSAITNISQALQVLWCKWRTTSTLSALIVWASGTLQGTSTFFAFYMK